MAAAVVLYTQADRASLAEARRWLRAARSLVLAAAAEAEPSVVLVLVGMGPPTAAEAETVADLRHRLLEVEAEAEAMAEEEGAHHMVAHGVGAASAGHTLMLDLAEYLLGRAVARREAEQAREKSLNDLDVTLHPDGLFVRVDADRLWRSMLRAASWGGATALAARPHRTSPLGAGLLCALESPARAAQIFKRRYGATAGARPKLDVDAFLTPRSSVLNAARLVDVGTEALQEAQEKLDALTAPKWWDRLVCTSRRAASPGPGTFDGD